jgi:hypothetical protein
MMLQELGFQLSGTQGTVDYYATKGIPMTSLARPPDEGIGSVITWIKERKIDLVINIADGATKSAAEEITAGYLMRRTAVDFGVSLITNIKCAVMFCEALHKKRVLPCKSVEEFIVAPTVGWANTFQA